MGMSDKAMGMSGDTRMLSSAKPIDREFIDMVVPHHQGAIAWLAASLRQAGTSGAQVRPGDHRRQSREIAQMHSWRKQSGTGARSWVASAMMNNN
jgi:uncharacterized protein (DUF305 family)